jgi:hypothetical protein
VFASAAPADVEGVHRLLMRAIYAPMFSVPNPDRPNVPIASPAGRLFGVDVNEMLHRFELRTAAPDRTGFQHENRIGEAIGRVHIRWMVAPDNFDAAPGLVPPPTVLDPTRSQRFVMLDGDLRFRDGPHSGFHAFGAGRTFPTLTPQGPQLQVGAVINLLEGFGRLRGLPGTIVVNGHIRPPNELALNLMGRFVDPAGRLAARSAVDRVRPMRPMDRGTTFVAVLGENDPDRPTEPVFAADGRMLGARVQERLRLVRLEFDSASTGIEGRARVGSPVGRVTATLYFDATDPRPVLPIRTTDGVFTFEDVDGRVVGTIRADMVEGRAFRTALPGAPTSVFRFGGFGPITGGSGAFAGVAGLMSMNAAISTRPPTLSNLYVLRLLVPDATLGRGKGSVDEA